MDYLALFEVGRYGLSIEKKRMDAVTLNIVNMNTPARVGHSFRPVALAVDPATISSFEQILSARQQTLSFVEDQSEPKQVYEPDHPLANAQGRVEYPAVDQAAQTITLIKAMHAYNANIKVIEAARSLTEAAIAIGS